MCIVAETYEMGANSSVANQLTVDMMLYCKDLVKDVVIRCNGIEVSSEKNTNAAKQCSTAI